MNSRSLKMSKGDLIVGILRGTVSSVYFGKRAFSRRTVLRSSDKTQGLGTTCYQTSETEKAVTKMFIAQEPKI